MVGTVYSNQNKKLFKDIFPGWMPFDMFNQLTVIEEDRLQLTVRRVWVFLWTIGINCRPHNVAAIGMSTDELGAIVIKCQGFYRLSETHNTLI